MQMPVIFLIGPVQHGKSTARRLVSELTGLRGASCSDVIYALLALRKGVPETELRKIPKETLRPELIEFGNWLCGETEGLKEVPVDKTIDSEIDYRVPSAIIRTLYHAGVHVIDGARRSLELDQARAHLQWNGVRSLVIWVEKTGGPKIKDSTTVKKEQADHVVKNDGTEEELKARLKEILVKEFPPPEQAPRAEPVILDASGGIATLARTLVTS